MSEQVQFVLRTRTGSYPFDLHHKLVQMGSIPVRQFWMDVRTLYDAGATGSPNALSTVEYFWDLCRRGSTQNLRPVQESYLLARLLPRSRKQGTCRVLADARERSHGLEAKRACEQAVEQLDRLLQLDSSSVRSIVEFRDRTGPALGLPEVDDRVMEKYRRFVGELLDEPCNIVQQDPERAVMLMLRRWDRALRNWGRHRDNVEEKQVLDILSYECRTSFHRAYSAVWSDLMRDLQHTFNLQSEDLRFLHLWHLDHCSESNGPVGQFHLFHGHVLGLHPAGATLVQSRNGQEILGRYLAAPTPEEQERPFQRLLFAMELAVHVYLERRDQTKQKRRKQPIGVDSDRLLIAEAAAVNRRHGRNRRR